MTNNNWPDPTPEMLNGDPIFDAIWGVIKSWDINVPAVYSGYCGATGNHARAIRDAIGQILTPSEVDARVKEARRDALIKAAARVSDYAVTAHQHGSLPIDPHECAKQVAWEITASITAMAEKGEGDE
jgi:creatinine amidohydrolase/Fe(II)-dependent formamide hydrolase-like protein